MLARASVIALPYRWIEGSGVLATALAQGVPPVATAVGTFPELCAEYDLGDPVPPDDPAALALALVRALTDPARAYAGSRRHGASPCRADLGAHGADDARPLRAGARGQVAPLLQPTRTRRRCDAGAAPPVAPWGACGFSPGSSRCWSACSHPAPSRPPHRHPERFRNWPARAAASPRRRRSAARRHAAWMTPGRWP